MLSPSSTDDEPTAIRRIMHGFSSKMRSVESLSINSSNPCRQRLSFSQRLFSGDGEEDESSLVGNISEKRSRFHDPLSSSIGRKRFASERAREVSSLEEENSSLKEQLETLKQENIADKAALSKLSTAHRNAELAQKRYLLEARSEAKEFRLKYEKELENVKNLQQEISEQNSNKENLSSHAEEMGKLRKTLSTYESKITELRQECFKRKKAMESSNEQKNNLKLKLESENASLSHQIKILELEKKEWEEKLQRNENKSILNSKLEGQLEKIKGEVLKKDIEIRGLKDELTQNKESIVQRNAMRQQLVEFPELVKQVESLKNENNLLIKTQENVELLKEKISSLEAELARNKELLQSNYQNQHEVHRLQKMINAWESIVRRVFMTGREAEDEEEGSSSTCVGPELLSIKLAELQRTELLLRSNLGEAQTDKKIAESRIKDLEETAKTCQMEKDKINEFTTEQAKKVKKLQRKLLLIAKERDSYKSLLDSYEHEVTFAGGQLEKDKVSMLENIITDHKDMITRLEEQLDGRESGPITIASNETQKTEWEGKILSLKKELESACNERDHLRYELDNRAIKGDYNPHNTRVIQFKNNPMAEASENVGSKIAKLQDENQALKVRIKLMEEGQMKDLTLLSNQKVEEGISSKEVEDLRNKVKSSEMKNERLMEAFKKTSKDFRKLTQELTGYRINPDSGDRFYRVISIYADSPDVEQLLFQRDEKGELLLLQNNYAETLSDLIKIHLNTQDSIPAFLAGLTLDLVSKQSFEATNASHDDGDEPICID